MAEFAPRIEANKRGLDALEKRLAELKKRLDGGPSDVAFERPKFLVTLRIGDGRFALPLEHTREIVRFAKPVKVPTTPSFVLGALNLRGTSHLVVDPLRLWGESGVVLGLESAIVLVEVCGRSFGIAVDGVEDVVASDALMSAERPDAVGIAGATLASCVWTTLRTGTDLLHVLDPTRLLGPALFRELDEALDRALELAQRANEREGQSTPQA